MSVKMKSRTFWITVYCLTLIPLSMVVQVLLGDAIQVPMQGIVTLSTVVAGAYVGKRAAENYVHGKGEGK